MNQELEQIINRTDLNPAQWVSLWVSVATRLGVPCYRGKELATWAWWAGRVKGVLSGVPTEALAIVARESMDPERANVDPAFSVGWEAIWVQDLSQSQEYWAMAQLFHDCGLAQETVGELYRRAMGTGGKL